MLSRRGFLGAVSLAVLLAGDVPLLRRLLLAAAGGGSFVSGNLPWFNVRTYGAVGDSSTDDTTAINTAIAALVSAGQGVLYFPASTGTYTTTGNLTDLSVPCLVLGDGAGQGASTKTGITSSSATENLFTVTTHGVDFAELAMGCTATPPSAGAGIAVTTGAGNYARYDNLTIANFYDNASLLYGAEWSMTRCRIIGPVRYGLHIANIDIPDGGDWHVENCWFGTDSGYNANAAIRIESAGGGIISGSKINCNPGATLKYVNGIELAVANSIGTADLLVDNCSIENLSGDGIHGTTGTGTSTWVNILLRGLQFGAVAGNCIELTATDAADFANIVIDDYVFQSSGSTAISLTKCDQVFIGGGVNLFGTLLSQTSCTNVTVLTLP